MEYVEGQTLEQLLKSCGGKITERELLTLMKPVIESLGRIHGQGGVIHGNIGIDSLMLDQHGQMKLLDFTATQEHMKYEGESEDRILRSCFAPVEQYVAKGKRGPWTDIYALCGIMYYCLTGIWPQEAVTRIDKDEMVWPSKLGIDISQDVEKTLKKGLEINPDNRYQSMEELARDLYALLKKNGVKDKGEERIKVQDESNQVKGEVRKRRSKKSRKNQKKWLIGSLVGILICGVGWIIWENTYIRVREVVKFGSYEQDNNTANGKEEIEWMVLDKEEDRVLVVSKYALDVREYNENEKDKDVTWETSALREWLNNTFIDEAFTLNEQNRIDQIMVKTQDNEGYQFTSKGGNDTVDKIFLLSIEEAEKYFKNDKDRVCKPTEYAVAKGCREDSITGAVWWWLRSPIGRSAVKVQMDGYVDRFGHYSIGGNGICVRPALWLTTKS